MWNPEDYAKNSDAQLKWAQSLKKNIDLLSKDEKNTLKEIADIMRKEDTLWGL